MIKTAIVILNWNGLGFLKRFLEIVIRKSADNETVVCVADNGSTDGSCEWIAENYTEVKLIRLEKNYGFAGGYSIALEQLTARYFVLLNSDIEVTNGWLTPLIDFMDRNPDVASCQPKILSYNRRNYFEYAGAAGGFIDRLGYPICRGRIINHVEQDFGQYDSQTDIFWSTGACMVVRSDAWKKCGGFDPDFFAHMEEIDLCWRFHKAGFRVTFIPGTTVYHVGGGTLSYSSPFKTYLNFRNSLYILYKNLPDDKLRAVLFQRKVLDGLASFYFLCKGQIKSSFYIIKAHIDFYRTLPRLKEKRAMIIRSIGNNHSGPILNKSVVFELFIKRHKTFTSLKTNF